MNVDEIKRINACKNDFYAVLGVDKFATPDEVSAAYRRLAKLIHPDKNNDAEATATFKILSNAYSVLVHPFKRRQYNIKQLYKNRKIDVDEVDHVRKRHKHRTRRHHEYDHKKRYWSRESKDSEKTNTWDEEQWEQWEEKFEEEAYMGWYWDEPWDETLEADVYWEWFVGLPWDQNYEEYMYWGGNWDWEQELLHDDFVEPPKDSLKNKILLVVTGFVMGIVISKMRKPVVEIISFETEEPSKEILVVDSNNKQLWALGAISSVGFLTVFSQRFRHILHSQLENAIKFFKKIVKV